MKILTVANQKGGVGKTTFSCHFALWARDQGRRTLLVDLDTQGNASSILTGDVGVAQEPGGSAALFDPDAALEPRTTRTGVDLLHGHQHLDAVDSRLELDETLRLRKRLRALPYERVVIDTPPAIGLRYLAPFFWSDAVVTPLEPNAFGVQGLAQTLAALPAILEVNRRLESRVAINRHIKNSGRQCAYLAEIEAALEGTGIPLLKPYLTQRVAVADALDRGLPVWSYYRADRELREAWRSFCEEAAA